MGRRIVRQPNGLLAEFSDVVDDFVAYDMDAGEAAALYAGHMSADDATAKVRRGVEDEPIPGIVDASGRGDGLDRYRECLHTVHFRHGRDVCRERHRQLSGRAEP